MKNILNEENTFKLVKIGILGAPINNKNMGCLALTYSLLSMLEEISKQLNLKFLYYNFEGIEDQSKTKILCQNLNISENYVKSFNIYPVEGLMSFCRRPNKAYETIKALKECDIFVDLTQGDSFSDIYGNSVFKKNANGKLLIERFLKKPLILGPQTYGPFNQDKNKIKAKDIIENASVVIARDNASSEYVHSFTNKKIYVTTDLAFRLPYKKNDRQNKEVIKNNRDIRVGLNVSGLLSKNKMEGTPTEFQLNTNYDDYIDEILNWLMINNYSVCLIPHVYADYECSKYILKKYPNVNLIDMCENPIEIKTKISQCDIFIGARMHATIAAFSSGVATIPTAYSRKFNGLYESVDYPYIVDLLNDSLDKNLEKTKKYVLEYENLTEVAKESMKKIEILENITASLIKEQILDIL